jgi:hypothetical protein
MIDWINTVPSAELAVELMAAFAPDEPTGRAGRDTLGAGDIVVWMFRGYPERIRHANFLSKKYPAVKRPILEATQLLEHAELVVTDSSLHHEFPKIEWMATRLGLATLADGKAAVRQRIKDRTDL